VTAQEIRSDGWQRDVGARNRTISVLAAEVRECKGQRTALHKLARVWRDDADACISIPMATALRGCADQVDAAIAPGGKVAHA
jgi:hypothetical protein